MRDQLPIKVLAIALLCCKLCISKSHYDVLGVPQTSTATVITKKYRQLAKQLHPDKNKKDPKAQDKFIELSKAYEILNDEMSRREYDHQLRFGGNSNLNQHQRQRSHQYNEREGSSFYNFNDEEVYIFRTPDGRTYTRSARDQFPGNHFSNDQQSDGFAYQTLNFDIGNIFASFQPTTILGWLTFIIWAFILLLGALLFFMISLWMTFHEIFPNISIFVGVFLLFVFLFSPSIFVCCGSRRKSVKPTIKIVKNKNSDVVKIAQRRSATELLKFNSNMLKEGKVCIISLNDLNEKHCLALQHRYEHDPLLFSRYKMVLENGNNHDNDNDDNSKDISSQNMNSHDMMALFENGKKWTLFKYPDKDFDNSESNLMDTRNTDFIDVWLSRLLGGEIIWTKTVDKDIPYLIELTDIKL